MDLFHSWIENFSVYIHIKKTYYLIAFIKMCFINVSLGQYFKLLHYAEQKNEMEMTTETTNLYRS